MKAILDICRAKALKTGEMVCGYYVKHIYSDTTARPPERGYVGYISDDGYSFVEVDPSTKQRYVGIDENGDPLFEGDVVEIYRYEAGERVSYEINPIRFDGFGFLPMSRHSNEYTTNEFKVQKKS